MKKFLLACFLAFAGIANAQEVSTPVTVDTTQLRPTTLADFAKATVKITAFDQKSGGTGSILRSGPSGSIIITNKHVCEILEERRGYYVVSYKGFHAAEKILKSENHDLCLVKVAANLEVNLKVSQTTPKFGDKVVVSGHPFLMPLTVTEGYLSESFLVEILVGLDKCTDEDFRDSPMLCIFLGGMPLVKEYNTKTVSATIAPGNSGSAVYNNKGEIVGLAFAGTGRGISYGIIVPHEYVVSFLSEEIKTVKWKTVNAARKLTQADLMSKRKNTKRFNTIPLVNNNRLVSPALLDKEVDVLYQKLIECQLDTTKCTDDPNF